MPLHIILLIIVLYFIIPIVVFLLLTKRPKIGNYLVVEGSRGFRIIFRKGLVIPFFEKYEELDGSMQTITVETNDESQILTKDNYLIYLKADFSIRINPTFKDIRRVSRKIGAKKANNIEELEKIFIPKFTKGLKIAGVQFDAADLYPKLKEFRIAILENIERDLNGFNLDDLVISYNISTSARKLEIK